MDQKSKINASDDSGIRLECVKGDIKFQHVGFRSHSRPDIEVLYDLCLSIKSGQEIELLQLAQTFQWTVNLINLTSSWPLSLVNQTDALVGESGSGKSTVIALLQRYYDPNSGRITLDGLELKKLKLKWLRRQICPDSQEPILFNAAVWENIAYGKEGTATEAEIIAAAKVG